MKLLIIVPSNNRGGVEEYSLTIGSAAVKKGWQVTAAFPETEGTTSLIKDFTETGITYYSLAISEPEIPGFPEIAEKYQSLLPILKALILPRLQFDFSKIPHIIRTLLLLLKIKPDVVMINLPWADFGLGIILACGVLQIPTVVGFHLIPYEIVLSTWKLKLYNWARRRRQKFLGISQSNCQFISQSFKIPKQEVILIPNGASFQSNFTPKTAKHSLRSELRQELGIDENSKIALTVARLSSQKGYDFLIPVIPHLTQEFPELKFVWVGDGEQREFLVNLVKEYQVEKQVLFLGRRRDVPRLLQGSDLFIFPTYYEGQPLALLEAIAYGLPVIASAVNGIPEVIENKINGLLTRAGDSCDLLEAIRWGLRHPEEMAEMAQKAQLRVQDFSEEKMLTQTFELLSTISEKNYIS